MRTTLSATAVCTCGSWIVSAPAMMTDVTATKVSQIILNALLMIRLFKLSNLQK
jgi:hypothetical protein